MSMLFTALLFLLFTELSAVSIQIARERQHPADDILLQRDSDDCPRSGSSYSPLCGKYNAALLGGCWCQCSRPSGNYTFFEPNNACVKASLARQKAECDVLFTGETVEGHLEVLAPSLAQQKVVGVPVNQTCSFYFGDKLHAQYLGCDGTWKEIPTQSVIDGIEVTPDWSINQLQIRVKTGATFLQKNTGRIFRVAVQCRHQSANVQARSSCVLFKVQGRIDCPVPQQTSAVPSATLPPPSHVPTSPPLTTPTEKPTTAPSSENKTEVCTCADVLPFKEKNCTYMTSGMVRSITDDGNNVLEVCSKMLWKPYFPQCQPLKGCHNNCVPGLVGHWRMDEQSGNEVADDSGYENHGWSSDAIPKLSKFSRGRFFDSAGNITFPNTAVLNFGNSSFSVTGWAKILDVKYPLTTFAVKKGFGCYFGSGQPGSLPGWEIGRGYRANGLHLCIRDSENTMVSEVIVFDNGYQSAQLLGQWVHYAVVFDREQQKKAFVYVNSIKQSNTMDISAVQGDTDNSRPLELGSLYEWKVKGTLDEYRVYNTALDEHEVASIFNNHFV